MTDASHSIQALTAIYNVTRQVALNADQHNELGDAYKLVLNALKPSSKSTNIGSSDKILEEG